MVTYLQKVYNFCLGNLFLQNVKQQHGSFMKFRFRFWFYGDKQCITGARHVKFGTQRDHYHTLKFCTVQVKYYKYDSTHVRSTIF